MTEQVNILDYSVQLFTKEGFEKQFEMVFSNSKMQSLLFLSVPILEESMLSPEYEKTVSGFQFILPGEENTMLMYSLEDYKKRELLMDEQYMDCILKCLEDTSRSLYLVGDHLEKLGAFLHYCKEQYPDLKIVGTFVGGNQMDDESLLNDINSTCPDVILTAIAPQLQEKWIMDNEDKLSGRVCIGADVLVRKTLAREEMQEKCRNHGKLYNKYIALKKHLVDQMRRKMIRSNYESYLKANKQSNSLRMLERNQ